MTEVTAGPALAVPGVAGNAGQRVCKRARLREPSSCGWPRPDSPVLR